MKSLQALFTCTFFAATLFAPPLHDAVKSGDLFRVNETIAHDTMPTTLNQRDEKGKTPLEYAGNKTEIAKALIFMGADARVDGDEILTLAAAAGNAELVDWLMTQGSPLQPNGAAYRAAIKGGFPAIALRIKAPNPKNPGILVVEAQQAIDNKDWTIVREKVEQGLDVNARFDGGNRLLHLAVQAGLPAQVNFLIEQKADLNSKNDFDETPVMFAFNKPDIFLLLAGAKADLTINDGKLLELAAKAGNMAVVKGLIQRGLKVHSDGKEIREALAKDFFDVADYLIATNPRNKDFLLLRIPSALEKKDWAVIKKLVENGLDVNFKDAEGNTLLHLAVQQNKEDMVQFLLKAGASLGSKNKEGFTPIIYAASSVPLIQMLEAKGADIHANNEQLLIVAAKKGYLETVRYLVNKKARLIDDAAIRAAYENNFEDVGNFLGDRFPDLLSPEERVVKAVRDGDKSQLKRLKDQKLAFAAFVKRGDAMVSPLWFAIRPASLEMVVELLKLGVDPDLAIKSIGKGMGEIQIFPIHVTAALGNLAIIKQLIENPGQKSGATPGKLLMAGADGSFTAADIAQARDWNDMITFLKTKKVEALGRPKTVVNAIITKIL